jgi:hypothetical protein
MEMGVDEPCCWYAGMPAETTLAIVTILMGGVLERHPKLRLCFAHGGRCLLTAVAMQQLDHFVGGSFAFTVGRIQHGYNVRPDLCATECKTPPMDFIGKFWVDSAVHDADSLELLIKRMGQVIRGDKSEATTLYFSDTTNTAFVHVLYLVCKSFARGFNSLGHFMYLT